MISYMNCGETCSACGRRPVDFIDTDTGTEYCRTCLVLVASGKDPE